MTVRIIYKTLNCLGSGELGSGICKCVNHEVYSEDVITMDEAVEKTVGLRDVYLYPNRVEIILARRTNLYGEDIPSEILIIKWGED